MIQANELRIGNYLHYRDKESFLEVVSLGSRFETINERGLLYGSDDIEEYNPIPLTEEILLKCGFEKTKYNFYIKRYNSKHYLLTNFNKGYTEMCVNKICGGQAVTKYLHQLQNLYFALTGEELEIKL